MSEDVYVVGAGMSRFGKFPERNMKSLVGDAVTAALEHAGVTPEQVQAAWVGNASQGLLTGQEMIRGQVALRPHGINGVPIYNVENACASGSTAFQGAWMAIKAGLYDCVLALGMEKMAFDTPEKKRQAMAAFGAAVDVEGLREMMEAMKRSAEKAEKQGNGQKSAYAAGENKSVFMDFYAAGARRHMDTYGTTQEQLALISSKNHYHASLNPYAQYRKPMTVEEVLADNLVAFPLTRPMCAPLGDGAAAAILCSERFMRRLGAERPVKVLASVIRSRSQNPSEKDEELAGRLAYEAAGVGPEDIDLAEVHDATAFGELVQTEAMGFCPKGEGGPFAASGATSLGGKIPVNVSGGLECRGHPIGATGIGQMVEVVWQLRGEAGERQVEGARLGLTQNAGGALDGGEAALAVHIFQKAF